MMAGMGCTQYYTPNLSPSTVSRCVHSIYNTPLGDGSERANAKH